MRSWLVAAVLATLMMLVSTAAASAATPALGSSPNWRSVDGAVPYGIGHAVPLKAATPAWFTDALAARVDAANGAPVAAPPEAALPGEVGIRPGSWMIAPAGCTMNFVFGSPGSYSIGTAGHCGNAGEAVTLLTLPGGANPVLVELGTVQKSVNGGIGNDFALVSIRPELQSWVSPTIAVVAGPCGSYTGSGPEPVFHYGHGLAGRHRRHAPRRSRPEVGEHPVRLVRRRCAWRLRKRRARERRDAGRQRPDPLVVDTAWLPSYIAGTRMSRILQIAGQPLANSPLC
jgi:hypothetical protein